ncbi:MAG: UDP-forming cellulose synthase catalytic subunit [Gammaproteobacteria bacterium]|nr:MAG: UDP-forming cellulose synthase catalytic subunit [Gammaproteobacteria bacterium]
MAEKTFDRGFKESRPMTNSSSPANAVFKRRKAQGKPRWWEKYFLVQPLRHHGRRLAPLFPHIDFSHLRPLDPLRILLQALWLVLVVPPARRRPALLPKIQNRLAALTSKIGEMLLLPGGKPEDNPPRIENLFERLASRSCWQRPLVLLLLAVPTVLILAVIVTTPLDTVTQALFMCVLWGAALLLRRLPGRPITLVLALLSVIASTRYLWWRFTVTLNWDDLIDLVLGLGLLAAETYAWLILILGFIQNLWPLRRPPAPLPDDMRSWPSVDVFIPTYNEPLHVVRPTVLAAKAMDWPEDKLNIYLLDDGRRDAFREFAKEAGVHYITRPDNRHAKAGNLNHALRKSQGDLVAIFDCDHIPVRSFLQTNVGWFLKDPKLALMQTPHHFYSPDPFERNLGNFRQTPNENELFYGVVQDGNDFWNAAFFCGSCAILKREPLEEIGGIAVETVTEDAHTALRLHRAGYNSAYLNIRQAAGLATESLSAHIGQRIRWARGMVQIFRLDNPFRGKGLTLAQRLCYSNAMLHFLSGIPRLIFLTAPLAFLVFHGYVIHAPAELLLVYVLPHLIHASLVNSRIQGKYRHSFWAEIYESALAWFIARPTTVALFAPHKGRFNVTAKGGLVDQTHFDWQIAKPNLFLAALNIIGIAFGIWRLAEGPSEEVSTVLVNLAWTFYNLVVLGATLAVTAEQRQVRRSHRVPIRLPALLRFDDGSTLEGETSDFSVTGLAIQIPFPGRDLHGKKVEVSVGEDVGFRGFPASVVRQHGQELGLRFDALSLAEQARLVEAAYGRADAWLDWDSNRPSDRPLVSLLEVLRTGMDGYHRITHFLSPSAANVFSQGHRLLLWIYSFLPRTPLHLQTGVSQ